MSPPRDFIGWPSASKATPPRNSAGTESSPSSSDSRLASLGLHGEHLRLGLVLLEQLRELLVVAGDVADLGLAEHGVAALHLVDGPAQRQVGGLGVGDDRQQQVGDVLVDAELEHLRVDHDHAHVLGRARVEQRADHRVDADRLAGAGGAGDQEVRRLGEVDADRLAGDVLAERHRQLGGAAGRRSPRSRGSP
jgi:hypothetical protein